MGSKPAHQKEAPKPKFPGSINLLVKMCLEDGQNLQENYQMNYLELNLLKLIFYLD